MKKLAIAAAGAALIATSCAGAASAQSAQDQLDAHYDRALAAGYKALFLCSGIANAERNGTTRTPESIHEWELTGIYPRLDPIIRDLPYKIVRRPTGQIAHVQVEWVEDMPDRVAAYYGPDTGCSVLPIGAPEDVSNPQQPVPLAQEMQRADPTGDTAMPDAAIYDTAQLESLDQTIRNAFEGSYGSGRTTAIVVRHHSGGRAQFERAAYARGFDANTPQRTWSVAKSVAATLVGAAVQSGEFDVDEPVGLNYWRAGGAGDARNTITIDHALRMASGRYSDTPGNRTDPLYWGGSTVDESATGWPLIAKPGTVYRYANNDTLMAVKAVESYLRYYSPAEIFAKLGMTHTVAETDMRGNYVLSSQVWSTARDLARLGQLYLNDGLWNGDRILPENWRAYVSDPSGPQPDGKFGYGAGWWLINNSHGVPTDTFAAFGNRGQYVVIVPSRSLVIVRRGEDMVGTRFDIAAFTRDVLAALD